MSDQRTAYLEQTSGFEMKTLSSRVLGWIPTLAVLYSSLLSPFLIHFGSGDGSDANITASQPNAINQLFWIGLFGLTLAAAGRRLTNLFRLAKEPVVIAVLAYLFLAFLSVSWSPVPGVAFRRLVQQAIVIFCMLIPVILADDRNFIVGRVLLFAVFTVAINAVAVVVIPPTPIGYAGIYSQKNALGAIMALAWIFCLYGIASQHGWKRLGLLATAALAMVLLVLSQSKTSLGLAILIPAAAYFIVDLSYRLRINAALLLLFFAALGIVLAAYISAMTRFGFSELSMLLFHDETFTGRTVIWAFVVDVISRSALIGQGYSSFWGIGADSIVFREAPSFVVTLLQSHNGYLDVLLETGAIGLLILIFLIFASLFSAARLVPFDRPTAWLCFTLLLLVICHNSLESSWFRGYSQIWLLFLFAALLPASAVQPAAPNINDRI
ncbi:O-antigen ligase family protein [uncultured Roseibium sp.]|uniref:O-antigen ligase family protein n=1 Tax=uncultured Roseibium sp. TaxID=1936171 RepID=UPI0032165A1A